MEIILPLGFVVVTFIYSFFYFLAGFCRDTKLLLVSTAIYYLLAGVIIYLTNCL